MFEKDLTVSYLLDFYGDVLPERTRSLMELYYGQDLSLSEIAESEGLTRQGIRRIIKKGESELHFFEERLGLAARFTAMRQAAERLRVITDQLADSNMMQSELIREAAACAHSILSENS